MKGKFSKRQEKITHKCVPTHLITDFLAESSQASSECCEVFIILKKCKHRKPHLPKQSFRNEEELKLFQKNKC
jgi:hypothetical protein